MAKFICPECGNEDDEPICKYCGAAMETLEVDDVEGTPQDEKKYDDDTLEEAEQEDIDFSEEEN